MAHRLAPQARNDLDEIWDYIFRESGSDIVADRTIDIIAERFSLLTQWPRVGRTRNDLRRGLRSILLGTT
jgi:toxin ParE1/3/4